MDVNEQAEYERAQDEYERQRDLSEQSIMSDTEFTEGPWELEQDESWPFGFAIKAGDFQVLNTGRYSTCSGQKTILENRNAVGFDFNEIEAVKKANITQDANLRLATASPDMFEVLQNLMGLLDTPIARRRFNESLHYKDSMISARAALSKAKGQKPNGEG